MRINLTIFTTIYYMIRPDLIFSYWIYLWYILYIFKVVQYNPKFAIIFGMIENLFILLLMCIYNTKKILIVLFIIMFFILKLIPLYTIWNDKIQLNDDIKNTSLLFIIYLLWIHLNQLTITDAITSTKNLILYNKNGLPGMTILQKIVKIFTYNK
jgi:hypothetical protein